jgi:hypothetical protein
MSGNQALDTGTSTGRLMLSVIAAVGQAEREAMLERQREGIAKAKREGRYKGRVPTARRQSDERSSGSGGGRQSIGSRGQAGDQEGIGLSHAGRAFERSCRIGDRRRKASIQTGMRSTARFAAQERLIVGNRAIAVGLEGVHLAQRSAPELICSYMTLATVPLSRYSDDQGGAGAAKKAQGCSRFARPKIL